MENKYPEGSIVYAKINPSLKLKVRRYIKRIYYCTNLEHPQEKEQVHFERELEGGALNQNDGIAPSVRLPQAKKMEGPR